MKKVFKILGVVFLTLLILLLSVMLFLAIKSNSWKKEFQSNVNSQYTASSVTEDSEKEKQLNEKIEKYVMNEEDISFVSFTPAEIAQVVYNSLSEMTEDTGLDISNVYIEPSENLWEICALVRSKDLFNLNTWICTDISKDSMQTAQLYAIDFKIQGINVERMFPSVISNINQGIAQALVTVNENRFVGRKFENIELQEDQMIVKGSLY
jgi:Na+-transporting methylmalonyl-CoA/oxaloacetate decarboxylase gamma subunit